MRFWSKAEPIDRISLPNAPEIFVVIRRTRQAKRLSLRVSGLDGRTTLTAPPHIDDQELITFVRDKEQWILKHQSSLGHTQVRIGAEILFHGVTVPIRQSLKRTANFEQDAIFAPAQRTALHVRALLKERARSQLVIECDQFAARLGRRPQRITLRDTRSRWGSCSSKGDLMFSWRLIMAPPRVLSYVAAHEVAHLKHMDHSKDFWTCVHTIYGPYQNERDWLRKNGAALHQFDFED